MKGIFYEVVPQPLFRFYKFSANAGWFRSALAVSSGKRIEVQNPNRR